MLLRLYGPVIEKNRDLMERRNKDELILVLLSTIAMTDSIVYASRILRTPLSFSLLKQCLQLTKCFSLADLLGTNTSLEYVEETMKYQFCNRSIQ